jgi:septal ring factor EnvC (AmiA/AmiB activator)
MNTPVNNAITTAVSRLKIEIQKDSNQLHLRQTELIRHTNEVTTKKADLKKAEDELKKCEDDLARLHKNINQNQSELGRMEMRVRLGN